jgi:hypothetical protein
MDAVRLNPIKTSSLLTSWHGLEWTGRRAGMSVLTVIKNMLGPKIYRPRSGMSPITTCAVLTALRFVRRRLPDTCVAYQTTTLANAYYAPTDTAGVVVHIPQGTAPLFSFRLLTASDCCSEFCHLLGLSQ